MVIYNEKIEKGKEEALVCAHEKRFVESIKSVVKDIHSNGTIKFVTLTGPSCSGKTTTASLLATFFNELGCDATVISVDDFYGANANDRAHVNFETLEAVDMDLFTECITKIKNKEDSVMPVFDFVTQKRVELKPLPYKENRIIIIEGIQTLYPEIRALLPREITKRIFIDVEDTEAYGHVFDRQHIRFCRRLVRDYQFRNSPTIRTLSLWKNVIDNENKNIYPNKDMTDYEISSLMPYGFNVMKRYLLERIQYDSSNPEEAIVFEKIRNDFKDVPEMSSKFVPSNSVYREFIGENNE
ncbi:MAG: hypothetical protein K6F14_08915 [Clostridiales bacterium]|nr:hypothetical protein [Clostridiales bacterium]